MSSFRGIASVSQKTQQITSEALKNLHPYVSEDFAQNFSGTVDPQKQNVHLVCELWKN